ncbi:MAG: polyprenyl synthetase family protein [Candidatus Altiarchaeota archaeon]|nr:polyprenyl synthetase family protein [Candidatus Altiarchaeota archaeon]
MVSKLKAIQNFQDPQTVSKIKEFSKSKGPQIKQLILTNLIEDDPDLEKMSNEYFLRDSKLIRPILTLIGGYEAGMVDDKSNEYAQLIEKLLTKLTPAVEVLHTATLIHDDIEDHSKTRRGKPTLHEMYGEELANNVGDYLYFKAGKLINREHQEVRNAYYNMCIELAKGQHLDLLWSQSDYMPTQDEYMDMILGKTGSLIGFSLENGYTSVIGKRNPGLRKIGNALGVSFQIMDDVLSTWSDNPTKDTKTDILEGKKTLPLLKALEIYKDDNPQKYDELINIYSKKSRAYEDVKMVKQYVLDSGAVDESKMQARTIISTAYDDYEFKNEYVKELVSSLIDFVLNQTNS